MDVKLETIFSLWQSEKLVKAIVSLKTQVRLLFIGSLNKQHQLESLNLIQAQESVPEKSGYNKWLCNWQNRSSEKWIKFQF